MNPEPSLSKSQSLRLPSAISNDVRRAGASQYVPALEEGQVEIRQALPCEEHETRKLSAHLIRADGTTCRFRDRTHEIDRRHAWLHHQQIRAFARAAQARGNRIGAIAHVDLVMTTIAELRRGRGGFAKWSV